jgi:hypothetical protein
VTVLPSVGATALNQARTLAQLTYWSAMREQSGFWSQAASTIRSAGVQSGQVPRSGPATLLTLHAASSTLRILGIILPRSLSLIRRILHKGSAALTGSEMKYDQSS